MSILLTILKIIGIILLVLLAVAIIFLVLLLFAPFCYRVQGSFSGGKTRKRRTALLISV